MALLHAQSPAGLRRARLCACARRPRASAAGPTAAAADDAATPPLPRRAVVARLGLASLAAALASPQRARARPAFEAGDGAEVGAYLPPDGALPGFVRFRPGPAKTPALRSGTIDPARPYEFSLPAGAGWKESKVANAVSGNYCQPRCDEPTTEVVFSSSSQGSVKVIISPLTKVTRLVDPQVSSVGAPMQLIASFGPYITGDSIDVDTDVVSATARTLPNGQEVYTYELSTPTALNGPHSVSALTFRGATAVLLVASANEKQWAAGAEELRKVVASFTIGG